MTAPRHKRLVANEPHNFIRPFAALRANGEWRMANGEWERGGARPRLKAVPTRSPSCHREAIKYRLDGSPLIGPEKRKKKATRTENCLSDSEFFLFRFFLSIAG